MLTLVIEVVFYFLLGDSVAQLISILTLGASAGLTTEKGHLCEPPFRPVVLQCSSYLSPQTL